MFCPYCGAPLFFASGTHQTSVRIQNLNIIQAQKCFCKFTKQDCEFHLQYLEREFDKFLSKYFPDMSKSEIEKKIAAYRKDNPIRIEYLAFTRYINRLKNHLFKLRKQKVSNTTSKILEYEESLSLSDWFADLTKE